MGQMKLQEAAESMTTFYPHLTVEAARSVLLFELFILAVRMQQAGRMVDRIRFEEERRV